MQIKTKWFFIITTIALIFVFTHLGDEAKGRDTKPLRVIVTSDTILSGMIASLLPPNRYSIEAILPPGQCPGHYDVKLSDIEKIKKADLIVSFRGMPFMGKIRSEAGQQLLIHTGGRNWMAPDSYRYGLGILAHELFKHFPEDKEEILNRKEKADREVKTEANLLIEKVRQTKIFGKSMIASSMQKELLEWMGFRIVGDYGRQESMSTRDFIRLSKIGKDQQIIMVVDNLQSGPEVGKGIAEALLVPHVVLTNFPSEKGYLMTLRENVDAIGSASEKR